MFCISIGRGSIEDCKRIMDFAEMVELRFDLLRFSLEEVAEICAYANIPIIATCRADNYTDQQRGDILKMAIQSGASHVDIEIEAESEYKQDLVNFAKQHKAAVIISYHNYESTPSNEELHQITNQCIDDGADIPKLATLANNNQDAARLLGLYNDYKNIVALGMGEPGKITRLSILSLGAPFTFVALDKTQLTAPGQFDYVSAHQLRNVLTPSHQLFAVIGKPIAHSKSPLMMNAAFQHFNLNANYIRLAIDSAEEAIETMKRYDIKGFNITSPYKADFLKYSDADSKAVQVIGGTNTFFRKQQKFYAHNSDYLGVPNAMVENGIELKNTKALVIGAGGAGRAAAYGLHQFGAKVTLVNRTVSKAQNFAEKIGFDYDGLTNLEQHVKSSTIVVSTLSIGKSIIEGDWLTPKHIIMDANYQYGEMKTIVEKAGARFVSGKEWLWQQALPAFDYFTNEDSKVVSKLMYDALSQTKTNDGPITLVGFPCSGKSTIGQLLAKKLNKEYIDLDEYIVSTQGRSIKSIFEAEGEESFRAIETACLEAVLKNKNSIIGTGGGIIVKETNRVLLKKSAFNIWLLVSPETAIQRVKDNKRPLFNVENPLKKAQTLYTQRKPWYAEVCDLAFDTEPKSADQLVQQIIENIGNQA